MKWSPFHQLREFFRFITLKKKFPTFLVTFGGSLAEVGHALASFFLRHASACISTGLQVLRIVFLFLLSIRKHGLWRRELETFERGQVQLSNHSGFYELNLWLKDAPYLLMEVTGTLTDFGLDIRCGMAAVSSHGDAVGVFHFTDPSHKLDRNAEKERLQKTMEDIVTASAPSIKQVRDCEDHNRRLAKEREQTVVSFEDSRQQTIVTIIARDRSGLLYRISSVFAVLGYNIECALINTDDGKAIDRFQLPKIDATQKALMAAVFRLIL